MIGERTVANLRAISREWGISESQLLVDIKVDSRKFNRWATGKNQPYPSSLIRICTNLASAYPAKPCVQKIIPEILCGPEDSFVELLKSDAETYGNVFDDIAGLPVVDVRKQENLETNFGGFYFMVRRHRQKNSFLRELMYVGNKDRFGVECFLYSAKGNVYRGGAYRNQEHIQIVFARPDSYRNFSVRFAMLRADETLLTATNGVMIRPTRSESLPAFAHILVQKASLDNLFKPHCGAAIARERVEGLRSGRKWLAHKSDFQATELYEFLWGGANAKTRSTSVERGQNFLGEITPAHPAFPHYVRVMNEEVSPNQAGALNGAVVAGGRLFHDSQHIHEARALTSASRYLEEKSLELGALARNSPKSNLL